jgi:hypothetical protein
VRRRTIGSNQPNTTQYEEDAQEALMLLNRCLSDSPRGRILEVEKSFTVLSSGEHKAIMQAITYHVGFKRQPFWRQDV